MGIVYRARHRQLNRVVALKVLHPRLTATVEARQRFEREIRILGSLQHPGVVMATDAGRIASAAYLVMEFIDGVDLARLVRRSGPLSPAEACAVGREMADALSAAHRAGAVHRDVKPSNVMIDRSGRVKLLDFGLAQLATLSADDPETSLGQLLGTLEYMAPEQARPEGQIDQRVDLYGLGATLFFLLTGRSPRGTGARRSLLDQLRSLSEDAPCDLSSLRPDVPAGLSDLIAALLSRDPACRPASAAEVAQRLSEWSGGNLAQRVADVAEMTEEGQRPDDRDAADRSLSQLLGFVPGESRGAGGAAEQPMIAAASSGSSPPRRLIRRIAGLLALAACGAAIWFGVTIYLETQTGTLRIESEVADVRVEVLDEKDQARELTIDRNERETVLRAGRYRVRLAGEHDGLAISPDVITLRHGKQEVAKITRLPGGTRDADVAHDKPSAPAKTPAAERLFKGEPESVWQQRFDAEIDAEAKLAAAQALVTLASELSPDRLIERVVSIGAALLESGWGDDVLQVPLNAFVPPYQAPGIGSGPGFGGNNRASGRGRGSRRSGDPAAGVVMPGWSASASLMNAARWRYSNSLDFAWRGFLELADRELAKVPAGRLADNLGQRIAGGKPSESSFAALLAGGNLISNHIKRDAPAVKKLLSHLSIEIRGLDQTALAVLLRVRFADRADVDAERKNATAMNDLASRLVGSAPGRVRSQMIAAWLFAAPGWPVDAKLHAALVCERLVTNPRQVLVDAFKPKDFEAKFPYRAGDRPNDDPFLAAFVAEANRRLNEAGGADRKMDPVVQSLDYVLRSRLPTDEWDVETTARLLTDRLRQWYVPDAEKTGDPIESAAPLSDVATVWPEILLTNIVRITGTVPEFARSGPPVAAERLRLWKQLQSSTDMEDGNKMQRHVAALASLLEISPYESLAIALAPRVPSLYMQDRIYYIENPVTRIMRHQDGGPPVDPLLLLAVLADLCGKDDSQDEHFSKIIAVVNSPGQMLTITQHLTDILTGPTALKPIAHDLLQKIRNRTQNAKLREAVAKVDPE